MSPSDKRVFKDGGEVTSRKTDREVDYFVITGTRTDKIFEKRGENDRREVGIG